MISVTVKVDLGDELKRLGSVISGEDNRRVMTAIGNTALRITWENFGVHGSHRPHEWAPLSKRYQQAIGYFGPPKLILFGDLITSIRTMGQGQGWIEIGTDIPYAEDHQYGTKQIPARPFFPIEGPADQPRLTQYAESECVRAAEREITAILGQ